MSSIRLALGQRYNLFQLYLFFAFRFVTRSQSGN